MVYQIRQNGKTLVTGIKANSADDALKLFGWAPLGVTPDVTAFIEHHGLSFINYGTTYSIADDNMTVAVVDVIKCQKPRRLPYRRLPYRRRCRCRRLCRMTTG